MRTLADAAAHMSAVWPRWDSFDVGIRTLVEKQLSGGDVGRARDDHERGLAVGSGGIGIGACVEKRFDHRGVRVEGGFGEWSRSEQIADFGICAGLQEARGEIGVVQVRGPERGVEPSASAAFTSADFFAIMSSAAARRRI